MEMSWIEKHNSNGLFENTESAVLLGIVFRSDNGCMHLNLFKRHEKGWWLSAKVLVASMLIYHYRRGDFIVSKFSKKKGSGSLEIFVNVITDVVYASIYTFPILPICKTANVIRCWLSNGHIPKLGDGCLPAKFIPSLPSLDVHKEIKEEMMVP
ncbi:hypothetical protein POTOM_057203 [Populus tomentosa]|uniref:Uncharacterized protein n=1 Tax=Populus tomentosa TaxID=118781 RepID=A0A8X7XW02_POPTO|nr:hypothetical protein POTOM_057203 [Populus tomentosa]